MCPARRVARHEAAGAVSMLDAQRQPRRRRGATAFSDYEDVSGVKMPKRLTTTIDKYPQFDLRVSKNAVDVDTRALGRPRR
jgi:hypothetical protein